MIILELFKKNRICTHDRVKPDCEFSYCPDCGELVENKWFITRCACCGVKLKATIKSGEVVWFGSNVVKDSERRAGLLDTNLYRRDELFDTDFSMTKAEKLDSGESMMDHAMVITGVDIVDGKPTKWKIENSWGEKPGFKGYFVMSDKWFDSFVYQAVINKKFLPDDLKKAYDEGKKNPIQLLPWDPMGALAFEY